MTIDSNALPFDDPKTRVLAQLMSDFAKIPVMKVLVVGCGRGFEAAVLGDSFQTRAIGIDIDPGFDQLASKYADLRLGDALSIDFSDEYFDAVYSFHALEHISNHLQALREMKRVLRKDGVWLIGTPNRERLVGYLGSKGASLSQKARWNIADWRARLQGKFKNEFGAHAGFSSKELSNDLASVFSQVTSITMPYYLQVYSRKRRFVHFLNALGIQRWVFPAVYFVGYR